MQSVIEFNQVSKSYGRELALLDFSLTIPQGVVFALLGENGAGKTTAIRILLGLARPDAGSSRVLEWHSQQQGNELRRSIGYVPDQPALYDWMTVEETGWFAAGFHGNGYLPAYRQLVTHFQLQPGRRVRDLSKGMRAKVALAIALANHPPVLVLDEPTSGLDAIVRREFLESMVDVAAEGRTVFLCSHQIHEVERVADMVGILRSGRLIAVERVDALKESTRELVITLENGHQKPPDVPGTVLSHRARERQHQVLVRGIEPSQIEVLRGDPSILEIEVRRPSLEDIYVGYMGGWRSAAVVQP